MFQGPLKQKIRFLAQKMCPVARGQTHKHTNTQTDTKVKTEDTLSGLRIPFLQPTIKERSNNYIAPALSFNLIYWLSWSIDVDPL